MWSVDISMLCVNIIEKFKEVIDVLKKTNIQVFQETSCFQ